MRLHPRLSLPHRTVRLRLTLLYGALFLVCGTALVAITYVLVSQSNDGFYTYRAQNGNVNALVRPASPRHSNDPLPAAGSTRESSQADPRVDPAQAEVSAKRYEAMAHQQRAMQMHDLLTQSLLALAITTLISLALGWVVAGRVLQRLRKITTTARDISASNLHERLALDGPHDELKELGDTFDQLLARLEASFQAQRQFIANASHELRTPMARQRTLAQVALADPNATVESLRAAHERVLVAGAQQEHLVTALLTLARGQAGLHRREPFDLARLAHEVLTVRRDEAEHRTVHIRTALSAAWTTGDPRLAERMIINLVDNALHYNVPDGLIEATTGTRDGHAVLSVTNTGPVVPESAIDQLFEPFERLGAGRTGRKEGLGLGLSIVRAIVTAHDATIDAVPRPGGGLAFTVRFKAAQSAGENGRRITTGRPMPATDDGRFKTEARTHLRT